MKVIDVFKDINVEIIETKSNGKPGMGHNSLFEIFKNNVQYDTRFLLMVMIFYIHMHFIN